jgi:hypothetical protein
MNDFVAKIDKMIEKLKLESKAEPSKMWLFRKQFGALNLIKNMLLKDGCEK